MFRLRSDGKRAKAYSRTGKKDHYPNCRATARQADAKLSHLHKEPMGVGTRLRQLESVRRSASSRAWRHNASMRSYCLSSVRKHCSDESYRPRTGRDRQSRSCGTQHRNASARGQSWPVCTVRFRKGITWPFPKNQASEFLRLLAISLLCPIKKETCH